MYFNAVLIYFHAIRYAPLTHLLPWFVLVADLVAYHLMQRMAQLRVSHQQSSASGDQCITCSRAKETTDEH